MTFKQAPKVKEKSSDQTVAVMPFLLPCLRLEPLIHSITSTTWDDQTWPVVKVELGRAMWMRAVLTRDGWWN